MNVYFYIVSIISKAREECGQKIYRGFDDK